MSDVRRLLPAILALHDRIRTSVLDAFSAQGHDDLASVAHDDEGDTIYGVDRVSEATLVEGLEEIARDEPICLVAEGLPPNGLPLPRGTPRGIALRDDAYSYSSVASRLGLLRAGLSLFGLAI